MKVKVISFLIDTLGIIPKILANGLEYLEIREEDITQTTLLVRSARILRRILVTWQDVLLLKLKWENPSWYWCEKLKNNLKYKHITKFLLEYQTEF